MSIQTESSGRTEEELDNLQYLPALADLDDPKLARELLARVEAADSQVERSIRMFEIKDALNQQLIEQSKDLEKPDGTFKPDQLSLQNWERIRQFQALRTSGNMYRDLTSLLSAEEIDVLNLGQHKDVLKLSNRVMGRLFSGSSQAGDLDRANKAAQDYIERSITSAVSQFRQTIVEKRASIVTTETDFATQHREFVNATDEATVGEYYQSVSQTIENIKTFPDQIREIEEQLKMIKDILEGSRYSDSYQALEQEYSESKLTLEAAQRNIRRDLNNPGLVKLLDDQIVEATRNVDISIPQDDFDSAQYGLGAITKEYDDVRARINLRQANIQGVLSKRGISLRLRHHWSGGQEQISEARSISSGRMLTHTAEDKKMYAILREGRLSSAAALDARGLDSSSLRTFTGSNGGNRLETHEVCFEPDRIYRIEKETQKQTNMALVFSENDLLSQGTQYVAYDGIHVFPPDYDGSAHQPGLDVDLTREPCMILVNMAARDEFVRFIREESRWSNMLKTMGENEIADWLNNNVTFVDNVSAWQADEQFKNEFNRKKNIRVRKGVVFGTPNTIRFKVGVNWLHKFKPTDPTSSEALAA